MDKHAILHVVNIVPMVAHKNVLEIAVQNVPLHVLMDALIRVKISVLTHARIHA